MAKKMNPGFAAFLAKKKAKGKKPVAKKVVKKAKKGY